MLSPFFGYLASLSHMPTVISLLSCYLVAVTKQGISCRAWAFVGAIAQLTVRAVHDFALRSLKRFNLSYPCSASCSALRKGQMDCEGSMDPLRATLCHYYCSSDSQAGAFPPPLGYKRNVHKTRVVPITDHGNENVLRVHC